MIASHQIRRLVGWVLSSALLSMSAAAQVNLTPASLSFGNVALGQSGKPAIAVVQNTQSVPLTISSIATSGGNAPGDFVLGGNCPISPNTLGASQSCNISIAFSPSALGSRTTSLVVTDSASNSPQSSSLSGNGIAPVVLSPTALSFGNLVEGTSASKTVTLKNVQTIPLTINSIAINGGNGSADYSLGGNCPISPSTLGSGASCSINVTFSPVALGSLTATLVVTDSAANSPQSAGLSGTGAAPVLVSPTNVSFGSYTLGTTSPAKTVTIISHLNTELYFSSIVASPNFAIGINTCGAGIGAGASCTVGVTFTPTALGPVSGQLTINDSAFGSPSVVQLSGTGNVNGLTSISVAPANPSISTGNSEQFVATGNFSNGNHQIYTPFVTWASSQPGVATIIPGGLATGIGPGSSTISATLGSVSGSTTLTVTAPVLTSIAVAPANVSLVPGNTQQFAATGTYSNNTTQNLTTTVNWSSSAANVATVSNASGSQGLATAVGAGNAVITAASGAVSGTAIMMVSGFLPAGNLNTPREYHTATIQIGGAPLLAGGVDNNGNILASAEVYTAASQTFTPTGNLNVARSNHTATLLNNGMTLMAGGNGAGATVLASAELYNSTTGIFTSTGSLNTARASHSATLLPGGTVLIAGGTTSSGASIAGAEIYSAATGAFAAIGNLNTGRSSHTATALNNGMVLFAGGLDSTGAASLTAELYNPTNQTFTPTGSLNTARWQHTATLLNNGMVLIAGGEDSTGAASATAELYNPATGVFTSTASLNQGRYDHTAALLSNGTVLIAGGNASGAPLASAEIYDPVAATFTLTGNLNIARASHTAVLLGNGTVLAAGGIGTVGVTASAEMFEAPVLAPPNLVSIAVTPALPSLALEGTQQFTATGTFGNGSTQQLASVNWSSANPAVATVTDDGSDEGVAYALANGITTMSACAGAVCGSTSLTVGSANLVSIAVTPANDSIQAGSSLQFYATGNYSDGSQQDLTSSANWNSSAPSVASIATGGLATTTTTGSANISAAVGSISGSTALLVTTTQQMTLGSVVEVVPETCPAMLGNQPPGWVTNTSGGTDVVASCYHALVSCPNMPNLGVTYGVATPPGTSNGTVAFVSANGGTFTLPGEYLDQAPFDLYHSGFQTVQFAWDSAWQSGSAAGSLISAACREATFLNYVDTELYQANQNNSVTAGMCAHSQSGGASGLAFSLTYYGVSSFIDKAVFVSGPHYGDLVQGCVVPNAPPVTICPSQNGSYPMGCNSASGSWTNVPVYNGSAANTLSGQLANNPVCNDPNHVYTQADEMNLTATSLLDQTSQANYVYPQTAVTAWECDDDDYWKNPSEGQGWIYLSQFTNPSQVAPNCNYSNKNTANPNACFSINRVYGCQSVELAATGYICNGTTCPVCTGNPATNCTCGGVACSSVSQSYGMPTFRDAEYEDPVNGCIRRH